MTETTRTPRPTVWTPLPTYDLVRDGVYLEVRSTSLNLTSYAAEEVWVDLVSQSTGDFILVKLRETGPNTGIYRSLLPVRLSATDRGKRCQLFDGFSRRAACSRASPTTGSRHPFTTRAWGWSSRTARWWTPWGWSSIPLPPRRWAGAVVSVRNPDGTLALDPDTGGATPLAPQTTGADGRYQFPRMFPGSYYLQVDPPATFRFPSAAPAATFAGIRTVNLYSYGRTVSAEPPDPAFSPSRPAIRPWSSTFPWIRPPSPAAIWCLKKRPPQAPPRWVISCPMKIRVRNNAAAVLLDAAVHDRLPYGFKYTAGSIRIDGRAAPDPGGGRGARSCFFPGPLASRPERNPFLCAPGHPRGAGRQRGQHRTGRGGFRRRHPFCVRHFPGPCGDPPRTGCCRIGPLFSARSSWTGMQTASSPKGSGRWGGCASTWRTAPGWSRTKTGSTAFTDRSRACTC